MNKCGVKEDYLDSAASFRLTLSSRALFEDLFASEVLPGVNFLFP